MLVGIILPDGFICTSADDIFDALASFWKPTFAKKSIDIPGATIFAKKFCCSLDFSDTAPPTAYSFTHFFKRATHSATGRNGIPYCAYEYTNQRSAPVFANTWYWIADGNEMEE